MMLKFSFNGDSSPRGPLPRKCEPAWCKSITLGLLLLAGCAGEPSSGVGLEALRGARVTGITEQPFVLTGGEWEGDPFEPGAESRPRAGLIETWIVPGDFSGSGEEEVAALLWQTDGGSGTRLWLAVFRSGPGHPESVAATPVGDRVQVIDFDAEEGQLRLELVAHGPDDAACCPGQHEVRRYRLQDGEVVGSTEVLGRVDSSVLENTTWKLERFGQADARPVEIEITLRFEGDGRVSGLAGCNEYGGTVTDADGRQVSFEVGATTMKRCEAALTGPESMFLARLRAAREFALINGRLYLAFQIGEDVGAMVFVPSDEADGA